jgi:hypothetical protein
MTAMRGKELLLRALKGEETPRPAWLPFVGCHGGKLIGRARVLTGYATTILTKRHELRVVRSRSSRNHVQDAP